MHGDIPLKNEIPQEASERSQAIEAPDTQLEESSTSDDEGTMSELALKGLRMKILLA